MYFLNKLLPHFVLVLTLGLIVLIVLSGYNPSMAFLSSPSSKVYLCILAGCAITLAITHIVEHFHE